MKNKYLFLSLASLFMINEAVAQEKNILPLIGNTKISRVGSDAKESLLGVKDSVNLDDENEFNSQEYQNKAFNMGVKENIQEKKMNIEKSVSTEDSQPQQIRKIYPTAQPQNKNYVSENLGKPNLVHNSFNSNNHSFFNRGSIINDERNAKINDNGSSYK